MPATLAPVAPTSVAPKPMSPPDEPPPKASAERRKGDETTAKISAERRKALEAALSQIERQFGQGSIMRLGEGAGNQKLDAIPTGSIALDIALGIGGVPGVASSRSTDQSQPESQLWLSTSSLRPKRRGVPPLT